MDVFGLVGFPRWLFVGNGDADGDLEARSLLVYTVPNYVHRGIQQRGKKRWHFGCSVLATKIKACRCKSLL